MKKHGIFALVLALAFAGGTVRSQETQKPSGSDLDALKAKLEQVLQNQQRLENENRTLRGEVDTLRADQSSLRDENGRLRSDDQDRGVETEVNRLVSRMEATAIKSAATALTLTGEFRYRTVAAFLDAGPTELDGWWTDARMRLGFKYDFTKDVTAFAELQSHWAFGDGASTEGATDGSPFSAPYGFSHGETTTPVDLYQGWMEVRNIFGRQEFSWRLGRQEVVLGDQYQFGNADWYAGWAFDGSRWDWNAKDFSITGLVMKLSSNDRDIQQLHSIANTHDNDELMGLYGTIHPWENHTIDLYWMYVNGHGGSPTGSGISVGSLGNMVGGGGLAFGTTAYFHTLGARFAGKFPTVAQGLDYNVEIAYELGGVNNSPVGINDVDGLSVEGELGITFSEKHPFRVYTRWLYAEGPGDNQTGYIPLYPNRHSQGGILARYGLLDALPMANVISGQLGLTWACADSWVLGAQGVWSTADADNTLGVVNGHDYGWEADLWALYQVTPQFSMVGGLIVHVPDDEGTALWGIDDTAVAVVLQARISF